MNDLVPVLSVLTQQEQHDVLALVDELQDAWGKRQVFRTETEARASVLNDGNFPTPASKYWQCVREQMVMLDNLVSLSFDIRRNDLKRRKLAKKLSDTTDEFKKEELTIDIQEATWQRTGMEQVSKDRVREILMWSQLKQELNDQSFDTANVNTHQAESLQLSLLNRMHSLTPGSSQAEVLNVLGPLDTINRLLDEQVLYSATHQNNLAENTTEALTSGN